jgi:hypothetical protein
VSLIKESGRLDIPSLGSLPVYPRQLDMPVPSWGPDWTFRVTSTVNSCVVAERKLWADKGSAAVASCSDDNNTLIARGFIVDTVDGLEMCSGRVKQTISDPELHQYKSHKSRYNGVETLNTICQSLPTNRPHPEAIRFRILCHCFYNNATSYPKSSSPPPILPPQNILLSKNTT